MRSMTETSRTSDTLGQLTSTSDCMGIFRRSKRSVVRTANTCLLTLEASFELPFRGLGTIGEYFKTLERHTATQASVQELESKMSRLRKANPESASLRKSLHVSKGSLPMLARRESKICRHIRPEPMLNGIWYMQRSVPVLLYSCYWTLNDKRVKESSFSPCIYKAVLVVIQVWFIL